MTEKLTGFPIVKIMKKLPRTMMARYFEKSKPRRIEISKDLLEHNAKMQEIIVLHEIGHWYGWEKVPKDVLPARDEEFAHRFATYFVEPKILKRDSKDVFRYLDSMPEEHKAAVRAYSKKALAMLNRN